MQQGYLPKDLRFDQDGRQKLIDGIEKIAKAVKSTLGPSGNTVLIESPNHTHGITVTKDGVTVAKSIDLSDPIENLAVKMVKEAADRTATLAGDGPQPLDAEVLTPYGWTTIGSLEIGDVICGIDGSTQKVEGVFDKGDLEVCEVVFSDGRVVECSANHLWTVVTSWGSELTLTTDQISADCKKTRNGQNFYKYYVARPTVDFFDNGERPLDPFTLGLLLGDGSLSGTGSIELSLGSAKANLIRRIVLPEGFELTTKFYEEKNYYRIKIHGINKFGQTIHNVIDSMGLLGVKSGTKFIPDSYLYAPRHVRAELLAGLLATDGYINDRGLFEFSTISDRLADDFQELIVGLGYAFSRRLHDRSKDSGSYSNTSIHRIQQLVGYKYGSKIIAVNKTGEITRMACIKVSNPNHLYITDGYIPTHNTTTSVVLTEALVKAGSELITDGVNRTDVLRALVELTDQTVDNIQASSKKVTNAMLVDVATISANNDRAIGKTIADAYKAVGKDGMVTVEKSPSDKTYSEVTQGLKFDRGFYSPLFINNFKRDECIFDDCMVLVSDAEINNSQQLERVLRPIVSAGKKLLIIAPCSTAMVNVLAANVMKNGLKFCAVQPPSFGYKQHELMQDIALSVGAKYFSEKTGDDLSLIGYEDLGHASKVIVSRTSTVIVKSDLRLNQDEIDQKVKELRSAHLEATKKSDRSFLAERIASLVGGVGVIYVGGSTDLEQKELFDRVDDAVCAVRSALEEGIMPGAGRALIECAPKVCHLSSDESKVVAYNILSQALQAPFTQILLNADIIPTTVYPPSKLAANGGEGYNLKTGEFGDLVKMGVIDPAKVVRTALQNAVSVAVTILSTNAIVTVARSYETV